MLGQSLTQNVPGVTSGLQDLASSIPSSGAGIGNGLQELGSNLNIGSSLTGSGLENVASTLTEGAGGIESALNSLMKALESSGGGGGGLGNLLGSLTSAVAHSGGIVGSSRLSSRSVSPLAFAGARRFHTGGYLGLRKDEIPLIAQAGEMIMSRKDTRRMKQAGVSLSRYGLGSQFGGMDNAQAASRVQSPGATGARSLDMSNNITVQMNVQAQDANSFKRSESQMGYETARTLSTQLRRTGNEHGRRS
jgi:hypothetical protein